MISREKLEYAMYESMCRAAVRLPPDVEETLRHALSEEESGLAKQHIELSLENARLAEEGNGLVCGDTGFPLFFVQLGGNCRIEGGLGTLEEAAQSATRRATAESFLRPTMVDPLSRKNPGNNLGPGMPGIDIEIQDESEDIKIISAPKGGGSEIFGTFYRMLYPADGLEGIKKFIIESIVEGAYAGKICPPAIIGVGIGGTADLCMKIAKKGALLRKLGKPNPDQEIARLEEEILSACRKIGLGPMGGQGINAVMAVHIETAMTHTAALPVAVNAQCLVGRRWAAKIDKYGKVEFSGDIE